jgi:hypothetical protein
VGEYVKTNDALVGNPVLVKNTNYYWHKPTWEFSLPAGVTCPFAKECKVIVGENCGKFLNDSQSFRCYAASAERFPSARNSRWKNYRAALSGVMPDISVATHVRIHMAGDFFSQDYFDRWLSVCWSHRDVLFWAFTKSLPFWVARLGYIPKNLNLTASRGGHHDDMIDRYGLKCATVYRTTQDVPTGMDIDTDDYHAANGTESFALLDNNATTKRAAWCNEDMFANARSHRQEEGK